MCLVPRVRFRDGWIRSEFEHRATLVWDISLPTHPFPAFLSGEMEPFSSVVSVAPRAFFCDRPGHCHTRPRRNRMPVFAARRYTTDLS